MRTTINLNEKLVDEARRLTGLTEKTALAREGPRALIERESARRLARLGGTEPDLKPVPRRRASGNDPGRLLAPGGCIPASEYDPPGDQVRETLALLELLALGQQDIARGAVSPIEEVVARIRDSRKGRA